MLKKVSNAGFITIISESKMTFIAGEYVKATVYAFKSGKLVGETISSYEHLNIIKQQKNIPVMVLKRESTRWWMFQDKFYWDDDNLKAEDIQSLILAKKHKEERKIERAKAIVSQVDSLKSDGRQPIPDDVKMFVWRRDKGHCVKCGSNKAIEFDHIIPVSQGGSNTARNLQILCEYCNRSKGGNLF